jgi:hypothetical protein
VLIPKLFYLFKRKAEAPENLETLQEACKKLSKQLQLTKELVSEKNEALEDAMSIIKQLQVLFFCENIIKKF